MRLVLALMAGLAVGVVPALAAEHQVGTAGNSFVPQTITVAPGDTVTWSGGSEHTLHFDGEATSVPLSANPSRSFPEPGTFSYYCDPHRSVGMTGEVVVEAAETTGTTTQTTTTQTTQTTTTQTTTTQTTQTTQTAATTPGTHTTQTTETATGGGTVPPVASVSVRATRSSFCVRRGRGCRSPGVRLRATASEAVVITGSLTRRPLRGSTRAKPFGTVRLALKAGTQTVRFTRTRARRRLTPGRYALRLGATGVDGLPKTIAFRVRS